MRCAHCKRDSGDHRSKDAACPVGKKTRIGWTIYSDSLRFESRTTYLGRSDRTQECAHGVLMSESCSECLEVVDGS